VEILLGRAQNARDTAQSFMLCHGSQRIHRLF
jgi:hypothetical protein